MKKRKQDLMCRQVQDWFLKSVTYEGEPYVIDAEQAAAVADDSLNAIVVARAGSGKTRTIVAKIIYLVAKCQMPPDEIIVFVFNANAAAEINDRLCKMRVDGVQVIKDAKIASTFHAFSRRIVYGVGGFKEKCGKILAEEKEAFTEEIVRRMLKEEKWRAKILSFIKGGTDIEEEPKGDGRPYSEKDLLAADEIERFSKMIAQFINRAQQKFLGGNITLKENVAQYINGHEIDGQERNFIEIGTECFRRYHWYLLNKDGRRRMKNFREYGTDFNLIVSWASQLILNEKTEARNSLEKTKYILIDEYQDFSQLFLAAVMAIRKVAISAKLFAVGDDWQAINRFAGSEVEYFKEFEKFFKDGAKRLVISTNYRCDYEIVDVARHFMAKAMKEKDNFRAFSRKAGKVVMVEPRMTELEYGFTDYDKRVNPLDMGDKIVVRKLLGHTPKKATLQYIKTIINIVRLNIGREILILHQNNMTEIEGLSLDKLSEILKVLLHKYNILRESEFEQKIKIMTMHKSKGLESDVVIILEADKGVIPKTHPDTKLYGVFGETNEMALDDQKRLFYVAMTRAKHRLYIIHRHEKERKKNGFMPFLGRGVEKMENN